MSKRKQNVTKSAKKPKRTVSDDDIELASIMAEMEPEMRVHSVPDRDDDPKPPTKGTTNDMWVYTLNNYTAEEKTKMMALHSFNKQVAYHVFGEEVAASGTPHLQGFICFTNKKRFPTVKNILGDRGIN